MGYTLNVDHWDWVNPETQKVVRLRRGDEVPGEVLNQEGINLEELEVGRNPIFLKQSSDESREAGPKTEAEATSQQATSSSPKRAEGK